MGFFYQRVLEQATISDGDNIDLSECIDLGGYRELEIAVTVNEAGAGDTPTLLLKHAPVNAQSAYLHFATPVEVDLTNAAATWHHVGAYTRFLGWFTAGTLSASAVVTVDIIAKN